MRLNVPGYGYYCPVQPNGLYISTENVNPSAYWPGTSWSLYGQDRFLVGAGLSFVGAFALSSGIAISISSTGGGSAHENRPPYIAVYFWLRTK